MNDTNLDELSFEASLKGLEEIVEKLSGSSNDLEDMLRLYAEGVKYLKHCQAKLGEAEARIRILSEELPTKAEEN
ncbi:MAG: exodeoxyribonuclease VII small subunit [Candidatus Cloacimonetes bacterium]|jgi:exodeoxyribonuclease VII small subunit|nr:exodeoxyribonuclease VII small subunit [Candidatus Cloacimonadota bacterium]MDY0337456.1 exodeoxyribonuclease VII small subunit [Candidatus Cloacimonadaceae bacterium]MCK9335046.1 exodeoxyribonuclease VII small subunit [Candidatus Cloacimonadota bacterium]MDD2543939.1 exodeoxyribonuclease VII small subunit [Candidatus Cloacimonadota bacterium]MDD2683950.1 exodeoxyribonuclease VII small subunit [Candidatus Cloacimonadota bacterium]